MAKTKKPKLTNAQILLAEHHLKELGIDGFVYEYQFMTDRDFRFDIYFETDPHGTKPSVACGIEVDGGKWSGGHRRGDAVEDDNDKMNFAQVMGILALRFTNEQVNSGYAKEFVAEWVIGK